MSDLDKQKDNDILESIEEDLQEAIEAADEQQVAEIVESISSQEALRQVSLMNSDERDQFMTIMAPEAAAELIEEAPAELAANMIKDLDSAVAAKIMEELQSDTQADIVQEMKKANAEAILSEMDAETAEDVRKLTQYDFDTAGGLMELDAFTFQSDETVGTVLKRLIEGDEEFERHRGQHPYILDASGRLVGVVSLRGLLRSKRAVQLSEIMTPPISVPPEMELDVLVTLFDENPFLGVPVVDGRGQITGCGLATGTGRGRDGSCRATKSCCAKSR